MRPFRFHVLHTDRHAVAAVSGVVDQSSWPLTVCRVRQNKNPALLALSVRIPLLLITLPNDNDVNDDNVSGIFIYHVLKIKIKIVKWSRHTP
jgi:hypothetical protein